LQKVNSGFLSNEPRVQKKGNSVFLSFFLKRLKVPPVPLQKWRHLTRERTHGKKKKKNIPPCTVQTFFFSGDLGNVCAECAGRRGAARCGAGWRGVLVRRSGRGRRDERGNAARKKEEPRNKKKKW
jgi:hypothetical protein